MRLDLKKGQKELSLTDDVLGVRICNGISSNLTLKLISATPIRKNSKTNVSLAPVYSRAPNLTDYRVGLDLPAINVGLLTNSTRPKNAFILGLYNNINTNRENGDYVAIGVLNRIWDGEKDHRPRYRLGFAGKISIEGIFRHRKTGGSSE